MNEGDTETCARAEFRGMCGMEKECEEEADELEGHRDEEVPEEGEYGAGGEAIYHYFT